MTIATVTGCLAFLVACVAVVMLARNEAVHRYRQSLLGEVSVHARADIERGDEWQWRYAAFDAVSYEAMLWPPWRRLASYYDNHKFHAAESRPEDRALRGLGGTR